MIVHEYFVCQSCSTELASAGIYGGDVVHCAECGEQFTPVAGPHTETYSRKARWSLILGLLAIPLTFLTGIAALVLGIRALREIRRSGYALKGRGSAVWGIILGTVFGVIGGMIALAVGTGIMYAVYSFETTEDPGSDSIDCGRNRRHSVSE